MNARTQQMFAFPCRTRPRNITHFFSVIDMIPTANISSWLAFAGRLEEQVQRDGNSKAIDKYLC